MPIGASLRRFGVPASADLLLTWYLDVGQLRAHAEFHAAKAGGALAAARLVNDLVEQVDVRDRFPGGCVFVPVLAAEASGYNAIPPALAAVLARLSEGVSTDDIVQINRAFHTGGRAMERVAVRPLFAGEVRPGARYVLVDDVTVMGSTVAELANHILLCGGMVVGIAVIVYAGRTGRLVPHPARVRTIQDRFGDAVQEALSLEPGALTADEAEYLLNFRDPDALRDRVAAALRERGTRLRARRTGAAPSAASGP